LCGFATAIPLFAELLWSLLYAFSFCAAVLIGRSKVRLAILHYCE